MLASPEVDIQKLLSTKDSNNNTALHLVVANGHSDILELLLAQLITTYYRMGRDAYRKIASSILDVQNTKGQTVLHVAVYRPDSHKSESMRIINVLVTISDHDNKVPLIGINIKDAVETRLWITLLHLILNIGSIQQHKNFQIMGEKQATRL